MGEKVLSKKSVISFLLCYVVVVILDLLCISIEALSSFRYFVKPVIVSLLLVFFLLYSSQLPNMIIRLMSLALIFSLAGDILLLFTKVSQLFFITGLVSFLIAHVMYIFVFLKKRNKKRKNIFFFLATVVYGVGLFYVLQNGLGDMLIPVIVYMIVILLMTNMSYLRQNVVSPSSYWLVFIGAMLFMVSDSLLAINMFHKTLPLGSVLVMITYSAAQFLIAYGVLKQVD